MTTDPYAPPSAPARAVGGRVDWAAAAVYALSGAALSYPPHSMYAELGAICAPVQTLRLFWIAPVAAALTGLAAGVLAAAAYRFGRTGLGRLALAFLVTWGAAALGLAAALVFVETARGRPAEVPSALIAGGVLGVIVSPAGLVPWGILELVRLR